MERVLNKTGWVAAVALGLLLLASLATVARGGPMDPPGPLGSTQENLIFQPASCSGFPITIAGGSFKLAQDIIMPAGCPQDGIHIGGDTTLDLQGFRLVGIRSSGSDGISVLGGTSNIEIRNGTVMNFDSGIMLDDGGSNVAGNSRLDDLRLYNNYLAGVMIGNTTSVTRTSIVGGPGSSVGILVYGVGNQIDGNVISGACFEGVEIYSDANVIIDNTLSGNGTCPSGGTPAMVVGSNADRNRIDGNTIDANGAGHAISVAGAGNTVTRNVCSNFGGTAVQDTGSLNNVGPAQAGNPLGANPWANIY